MNQLMDAANRYIKSCDWRDIALLKVCVCAGCAGGSGDALEQEMGSGLGRIPGVCGHLCAPDGQIPSVPFGRSGGDQRYL
ncbi:hypothetical protein [uncultured Oscillibacter sp.]|uniref:hypothetical protein n=1 Tax=uncultured Oscillibacter sp. TaxID=876091 RepID=UPI00280B49FC|nr:hypothetical protein [uncultured Oscillibacter sp.]